MTSLPWPLPGRDASNVVFPDLAPAPSVVAAHPLGLSPETAASPDLSYSQPYGHLLPYSYPEPATPGDAYLPSQQLSAAWSQPFHPPVVHPQELETGKCGRGGSSHLWGLRCVFINFPLFCLHAASGTHMVLGFHGIGGRGGRKDGGGAEAELI